MPDALPACFRSPVGAGPAASPSAGPSLATSVYETHLGLVALSWSRTAFGLSLRAVLRLSRPTPFPGDSDCDAAEEEDDEEEIFTFRVRPWLFWKRRGTKRFPVRSHRRHRHVDLAWDLTRARFPGSGSPEPSSGFFVAVVVDGDMALVAGDLVDDAYRKTKSQSPNSFRPPALISRREHVAMCDSGHGRRHKTTVSIRGKEREISIDLVSRHDKEKEGRGGGSEVGMCIAVDGERVLHVRRLRWKFRGSERLEIPGGDGIHVSWDLHNWLFPPRGDPPPPPAAAAAAVAAAVAAAPPPPNAHAVFVFRFELAGAGEEELESREKKQETHFAKSGRNGGIWKGYFGKWGRGDWSESSSGGDKRKGKGKGRRLAKASSSSSASVASSTASWASGSTVMDWASPEEAEMRGTEGFSLLVYAWKS